MSSNFLRVGTAALALALTGWSAPVVQARPVAGSPAEPTQRTMVLAVGRGEQIKLPRAMSDVFVADPAVADVDARSTTLLYVFGKGPGETNIYATDRAGHTVWSATVRVASNLDSIGTLLHTAMPHADIKVTTLNGVVLLTGTVAQPEDVAEARDLVRSFVGDTGTDPSSDKIRVISRLATATPVQVMLKVRIAEVTHSLSKQIQSNLATRDTNSGFNFGLFSGRQAVTIGNYDTTALPKLDASSLYGLPAGTISLPFDPATGKFITGPGTQYTFNQKSGTNTLALAGKLFGIDVGAAFDMAENAGLATMLAQPTLTTVSGETANFLAGGQYPYTVSNGINGNTIAFKNYGVSLSYTPTVLSDGRIALRVRPEVSQLQFFAQTTIPGLQTRNAETTVILGSGQSFMIAGLLDNRAQSTISKIPGAGDIPILGNLFKSNQWQKDESELMIVVTPYLVNPVSDDKIVLPTDGYQNPTDLQRLIGIQSDGNKSGKRPMPTVEPAPPTGPGMSDAVPAPNRAPPRGHHVTPPAGDAAPGFSN